MDAKNVVDGGIGHRAAYVLSALENMQITRPDAPKGFVTRLAEENGWTIERAEAADREYRRFLMLAWSTDDMVVPSRDVDAAWHEHLLHTRHYWDTTCRDILGKQFHHDPGDGSMMDADMHAEGYGRTLALYERIFGEAAPSDVWPRGCTCGMTTSATQDVELAMPAWTILAAATMAAFTFMHGLMAWAVTAALALTTVVAAITRARSRSEAARHRSSVHRTRTMQIRMSENRGISLGKTGTNTSSTSQSRSSDDAVMASLWMSDAGGSSATTSSICHDTSTSHSSHSTSHDAGSSHSSHSCGGSSHSCGGSSCGGSSCGGGGCGGS